MDDPIEFIGSDRTVKADAIKIKASTPLAAPALAAELAQTEKPKAAGSHPKHAIVGPAKAYAAATAETEAARIDYQAATFAFKDAEKAEGVAVAEWIKLNPPPTADEVYRSMIANEQAEKLRRVQAGLPAVPPRTPTHGNSVIDRQAAQRPRQTPQMPSAPLRSPIARRLA
jgi:hypothetical protein